MWKEELRMVIDNKHRRDLHASRQRIINTGNHPLNIVFINTAWSTMFQHINRLWLYFVLTYYWLVKIKGELSEEWFETVEFTQGETASVLTRRSIRHCSARQVTFTLHFFVFQKSPCKKNASRLWSSLVHLTDKRDNTSLWENLVNRILTRLPLLDPFLSLFAIDLVSNILQKSNKLTFLFLNHIQLVGRGLHCDLIIENKHYDIFWSVSCAIKGYENGNIFYITPGEFTKFFDQCPFYLMLQK